MKRVGGILKVYITSSFSQDNHAQNMASLCDPEIKGTFTQRLLGFCVLVIKEHTSKEDKVLFEIPLSIKVAQYLAGHNDEAGFLDRCIRQARVEKKRAEGGLYIN